ncbi:MAG: S46 family peptidase [Calditrichaceae bacterium]|nr:S46 family peptidase [Calditrichaceae bacterium]MBN2708339.1 S46 family peptidase [Calditrichaceae bacterium]RQV95228.1 MAG: S46 family peptidase [Calditrichota bacterium]
MKKVFWIIILLVYISFAEEGMWMMNQLASLGLKEKGLKINIKEIYDESRPSIVNTIVNLGGATAELVSPDGLLLTNHHVAFGAVQRASTQGIDYITNGFLAKSKEEEIPAPGYIARIIQRIEDVTDQVLADIDPAVDPVEKEKAIEKKIKQLTDQIEGDRDNIEARIAGMYEGNQYVLFVYDVFEDVRMVYVPPQSIGNYGGDIDNWMWPRHTGDFSFLRVYTAPDGKGSKYSKDNMPYRPKRWLKIASDPLKDGDFTFILGYPGLTTRYRTSASVDYYQNYFYPNSIKNFSELISLLEEKGKESQVLSAKVAGLLSGLNNAMKNYQGNLDGMNATGFLQKKKEYEAELVKYINSKPELKKKYGNVLGDIVKIYEKINSKRDYDYALGQFNRLAGTLNRIANNIYYVAKEREKPDSERDPGFSEKDIQQAVSRLKYTYMSYDEGVDKALFKRALNMALSLPEDQTVVELKEFMNQYESVDAFLNAAYTNTRLTNIDSTAALYSKPSAMFNTLNEPLIRLAAVLYPLFEKNRKSDEQINARLKKLRKDYIAMLTAWKGSHIYPDANGTIRLTFGEVAGYKPRDAVEYKPFTTLTGVIEKDTGKEPFNLDPALRTLYNKKDYERWICQALGDVPVAFTHKCDITGGNSGSPVMNAKGELVGIAFDGNYEALTCDWQYDDDLQRTISVDIRYVLFITEKFAGAQYLLDEMGIK